MRRSPDFVRMGDSVGASNGVLRALASTRDAQHSAAIRSGAAPPRIHARQRSKVCCRECLGRPWRGDTMKRTHLVLKTGTVKGVMVAVTAVGVVVAAGEP